MKAIQSMNSGAMTTLNQISYTAYPKNRMLYYTN